MKYTVMTRSTDGKRNRKYYDSYNNRYDNKYSKQYDTRQSIPTINKKKVYKLRGNNKKKTQINHSDANDFNENSDNSELEINVEDTDELKLLVDNIDTNTSTQKINIENTDELKPFIEDNNQFEMDNITKEIWEGNKQSIELENMIRSENYLNFLYPLSTYPVRMRIKSPITNDIIVID